MANKIQWQRITKDGRHIHSHEAKGTFTWRGKECTLLIDDSKIYENDGHDRWFARIYWGLNENGGWDSNQQHVFFWKTLKASKEFLHHLINENMDECERMMIERAMKTKHPVDDIQIENFVENILNKEYDYDQYGLPDERADGLGKPKKKEAEPAGCAGVVLLLIVSAVLMAFAAT